jgi:hypothetical protein
LEYASGALSESGQDRSKQMGETMKTLLVAAASMLVAAGTVTMVRAADVPPPWAYGFNGPPPSTPAPPDSSRGTG